MFEWVMIPEIKNSKSLSTGPFHMIASTKSGVYSWGYNHKGQLGIGSTEQSLQPREIQKFNILNENIEKVQAGTSFSLALT